jgi:nicotinamide mononucleotide transporter
MTWIEAVAALFGFFCVWLTVKQNLWCWPVGLVQVFLYIFVFYEAKLYADMALHVIYVGLSIYGWIHWRTASEFGLPVTHADQVFWWIIAMIAGTVMWGYSLSMLTDASVPYPDSFIVAASLIAQWLMARKKLESWLFWIAADIVAIVTYAYKGLYFTTGLYSLFLVMAILGYFSWHKSLRRTFVGTS